MNMELSINSITKIPKDIIYVILSYCNVLIEKSLKDTKIRFINKLNKEIQIFNLLLKRPTIKLVNSMMNRNIIIPSVYLYIKPLKWYHLFYGYINDFYLDNDEEFIEENIQIYVVSIYKNA